MPFIDADTPSGRRWISERDTIWMSDPLRRAAETFARDVETFLYDETDEKHGDVHFLAWAVARYDLAKTGSGRYADTVDYDPNEALKDPLPAAGDRYGSPGQWAEIDVRMPRHALEKFGLSEADRPDVPGDEPAYSRPDLPSGVTDGRKLKGTDQTEQLSLVNDKPFVSPNSPSGEGRDSDGFEIPQPDPDAHDDPVPLGDDHTEADDVDDLDHPLDEPDHLKDGDQ